MAINVNCMTAKVSNLGNNRNDRSVTPTPYEYNGGYNYKPSKKEPAKYCISVDWLELTTKGYLLDKNSEAPALIETPCGIIARSVGHGTKHYSHVYEIFLPKENQPFAQILTMPRNDKILEPDFSQVKIENHQLYRSGWTVKLAAVLDAFALKENNETRLDVAIDGIGFLKHIEQFEAGEIQSLGRVQTADFKTAQRERTGYNWGKRSSEKMLTIYNKTLELGQTNKNYIIETWIANNLNGGQLDNIERLELKLRGKALKRLLIPETGEVISWRQLENPAYLAGIVQASFKKWFEFVIPDNQKNVSRKERVQIIDFKYFKAIKMERLSTTKKPSEVWQAKLASAKILKDAKQHESYLQNAMHELLHSELERNLAGDQGDLIESVVHDRLTAIFADFKKRLPVAFAYAIAKEHQVVDWLERKEMHIEKDLEAAKPKPLYAL